MESRVRIEIKRKRKFAKSITTVCFIAGIFLLIWSYIGENYDIAYFSDSPGKYGEIGEPSIFYTENNLIWGVTGLVLILLGFLIKYRKKILSKANH